jgi:hypothetical protein
MLRLNGTFWLIKLTKSEFMSLGVRRHRIGAIRRLCWLERDELAPGQTGQVVR